MNIHPTEDLSAFALGALDSNDHYRVSTHLAICDACSAELEHWFNITAMLPYTGDLLEPSPKVKERLFALVDSSARPIQPAPKVSKWQEFWSKIHLQPLSSGVLALMLLAMSFMWFDSSSQVKQMTSGVESQNQLLRFMSLSTNQRRFDLQNQAQATLYLQSQQPKAVLSLHQVTKLPDQQYYQVWLCKGDKSIPVARFNTDESGYTVLPITSDQMIESYDQLLITIEQQQSDALIPSSNELLRSSIMPR